MKSTDALPPYETSEIGTPKDYTDDLYLVYFEIGENKERAKAILESYLGADQEENIVVYQVNLFAKVDGPW